MEKHTEERCIRIACYVIQTGATVRKAAKKFGVCKSTVHRDLTENLRHIDKSLFLQAAKVLKQNKDERHIRGGIATQRKYLFR